jgi:hypothetical protein
VKGQVAFAGDLVRKNVMSWQNEAGLKLAQVYCVYPCDLLHSKQSWIAFPQAAPVVVVAATVAERLQRVRRFI